MYQNKHQSDPNSVLHSIGATQGMGAAAQPKVTTDTTTEICPTQCAQPIAANPADEKPISPHILKLMIPEDQEAYESEDILQTTIESAKQIQQLAERLKQNQSELAAKEASLDAAIQNQATIAAQAQLTIEKRLSQLQQQTAQVRLQQRQVMQLQSSIVESHEATKIAIEQLVASELTDATTLQQMKAIQFEVSERFDYISLRWQQLHDLLENQRILHQATRQLRDAA